MNIRSLLKRKEPSTDITELLRKDDARKCLSEVLDDHTRDMDGIIIIWAAKGELYYLDGGIDTETEALGILSWADEMVKRRMRS